MFLRSMIAFVTVVSCSLVTMPADANRPNGGVRIHYDTVVAEGLDVYEPEFVPGPARIVVKGDHDTDLDCFVVTADADETPVVSDDDTTDTCILNFNVLTRGVVRVKILNLGQVYNDYTIEFR